MTAQTPGWTPEQEFVAGYALAVANIMHTHGDDTIAEDVLNEGGITLAQVKSLGLTEFDMKVLRKLFREIARKSKLKAIYAARRNRAALAAAGVK